MCNKRANLEKGDILFSGTGTIGITAVIRNKPYNWNIKEGIYSLKPYSKYINSYFLKYILETEQVKTIYMNKAVGGTVKSIPMKELNHIEIPIPPLEVQVEIVNILDKFERMCNSLTEGLPSEIAARKSSMNITEINY